LNLILAPGDPSNGRRTNTLIPFRNRPGPRQRSSTGRRGPARLPDTGPLRNQVEAAHGCDWLPRRWVGRSPFARLWSALRCIFRQRARIVDAQIAIKNAVGTSSGQATPAVPPLTSIIRPAAILRSLRLARFKRKALSASGLGLATILPWMSKARSRAQILMLVHWCRGSRIQGIDLESKSL